MSQKKAYKKNFPIPDGAGFGPDPMNEGEEFKVLQDSPYFLSLQTRRRGKKAEFATKLRNIGRHARCQGS